MIRHLSPIPAPPARVVVIGAAGFVGQAVCRRLTADAVPLLALTRHRIDLLDADAASRLADLLRPDDVLVAAAAIAPCKTPAMLVDNMRLVKTICDAIDRAPIAHLVNIGSDAIYADQPLPLVETSPTAPESLHGVMHLAREAMLRVALPETPMAFLRPTLIHGAHDPHNGYGPNRFRRQAVAGGPIRLFGNGEERRDHIFIDDVADIAAALVFHRSIGAVNAASGKVVSFRAIAEKIAALAGRPIAIEGSRREGPMPHGGYRPFDIAALKAAFPTFDPTPLDEALKASWQEEAAHG